MNMRSEDLEWKKGEKIKSVLFFTLHWVIMIAIIAVLLFGDKLGSIGETFQKNADFQKKF